MTKKELSEQKFQSALDKLNKSYGPGTIMRLTDGSIGEYDVVSTGSLSMDYLALGVGGVVKGRLYELMGWEGVGKSTVCGHIVAQCQEQGGNVLYVDAEHSFDEKYFSALGVDLSKLLLSQPSTGEEGFEVAIEMIRSGDMDLVILDSDSSLIPKKVIDGEIGDSAIGLKARLNSSVYPKLKFALKASNTCVIVVSQYREKIGVMFGNPTVTQGGHALKYYADCRIELTRTLQKEGDDVFGATVKVKTVKNKTYPPYKKAEFDIIWGKGIDKFGEIVTLAAEFDIIKRSGAWYSYDGSNIGQGLDNVKLILNDNPELYDEIKEKVLVQIKNK